MNKLPKAKSENIVVNHLKDEVLIYDLTTNKAVCLNSTSSNVYNACDGVTTFAELKAQYNYTDEIIYLALDELQKENLITGDYSSPFTGMTRREVIHKVGLASMIALPVISAIIAPSAAMAASTGSANCQTCTNNADCASGKCLPNALGGGGNLCAVSTQPNTYPLGTGFGASDAQCTGLVGPGFCCSGQASKASGTCRCE